MVNFGGRDWVGGPIMPIYRFLREAAFDQADIDKMTAAYEAAIKLLRLADRSDPICETIAKKIIELARDGIHDPPQLCARTLKELGIAPPEHRRSPRLRTLKGGLILFSTAAAIDCTIRNMSETGAALEVESPVGIPDDFTLLIKPELIKRNCRVVWRSAKRIGVRFA
jgi:hypothetical protein